MHQPKLTVIAGCNGSGKSSHSSAFAYNLESFDYDKKFLNNYNSLLDNELRELMAHNITRNDLKKSIHNSINNRRDFIYETNFNSTPLYWPEKFKLKNYRLILVFFCLQDITLAKERVKIRVENGGHYVPDNEIEKRYNLGFKHLNDHWAYFDEVHLFETSSYKSPPSHFMSILNGFIVKKGIFPNYLNQLTPSIFKLYEKQ